jgi:hypothetical protein
MATMESRSRAVDVASPWFTPPPDPVTGSATPLRKFHRAEHIELVQTMSGPRVLRTLTDSGKEATAGVPDADVNPVKGGMSTEDAAALAGLVNSRLAGGQSEVSHRRRWPVVITWFDTSEGRYLAVRDGEWMSFTPAGNDRVAARIDQALSEVTQ